MPRLRHKPQQPAPPPSTESFTPERLAELRAQQAGQGGKPEASAPPPVVDAGQMMMSVEGRNINPLSGLPALGRGRWMPRPSVELAGHYDDELADRLADAAEAMADANAAAQDALAAQPGGNLWSAAVRADAVVVCEALDRGDDPPDASPLAEHMSQVMPDLVAAAWRAQAVLDRADRLAELRAQAIAAELSARCDEIEADIAKAWAKAERTKDRADYLAGRKLSAEWAQAVALWSWCRQPNRPYSAPLRPVFPARLDYAEYQADIATGGTERISPPFDPDTAAALDRIYGGGRP
jgi:hypothetical protein